MAPKISSQPKKEKSLHSIGTYFKDHFSRIPKVSVRFQSNLHVVQFENKTNSMTANSEWCVWLMILMQQTTNKLH